VSIQDRPADLNEFYGSLVSMDDPRHVTIRRIVARGFPPNARGAGHLRARGIADDVAVRVRRTATRDVELSGHRFAAGDKFVLVYGSANRDPAVFPDPEVLDLGRDPNPHVCFGARGPHFCLGAHLARREIGVAFRTIFDRLSDLGVSGEADRPRSSFGNGVERLPARLTGER
jgi:cytochrome P450